LKRVAIEALDRRHFELVLESLEIDPQDLKVSSS
jgi:hypothetical protein